MNSSIKYFFEHALICRNGHLINSTSLMHPELNRSFCPLCSCEIISKCPDCSAPIYGKYMQEVSYRSSVYGSLSQSNVGELRTKLSEVENHPYEIPAYCPECGKAFPWTKSRLDAAQDIIDMLDELSPEQRKQLKDFIPDLIVETPKSKLAELVYAKFLESTQSLASCFLRDWLRDNLAQSLTVLARMLSD